MIDINTYIKNSVFENLKIKNVFEKNSDIEDIINSIFNEFFNQNFNNDIIDIKNDNKHYILINNTDNYDIIRIKKQDNEQYNKIKGAICADIIYRIDIYKKNKYNVNKGLENIKKYLNEDLCKFDFDAVENDYLDKSSHTSDILLWNSKYTDLNYKLEISFDVHAKAGMASRDYDVPNDPDEFYLKNLNINDVKMCVNNNSFYDDFDEIKISFNKNELKEISKKLDDELDTMLDIDDFDIYDYI